MVRTNSRHVSAGMAALTVLVLAMLPVAGCTRNKAVSGDDKAAARRAVPPTSHPAAAEKDYEYLEKVWETEVEREVVEYLTRAHTAEKAYRMVRKEPAALMPLLRKAVRAQNSEVRVQSVIILALLKEIEPESTVPILMDALLYDAKPEVRAVAAKSFTVYKAKQAVPSLIRSLNEDPFEGARANAAWALGETGDISAIPYLRKSTADDDAFVRLRSVGALMDLRAKNGIPELIERLSDSNAMVAERAHQALRHITGTDKGRDPAEWRRVFGRPVGESENVGPGAGPDVGKPAVDAAGGTLSAPKE